MAASPATRRSVRHPQAGALPTIPLQGVSLRIDADYQEIVKGIIIVAAVIIDQYRQRRRRKA